MSGRLDDPYQLAMERLAAAYDDYEREASALRARQADVERSAARAVERSAAAVAAARSRVAAAQSLVDQVTADVTAMWRATLEAVPRSLAGPDEPLPAPAVPEPGPRRLPSENSGPGMRVATVLGEAQAALAALRHRRRPSGLGYLRLAVVGAVAAAAGYAAAHLLASLGHALGPEMARPAVWGGRFLALVAPLAGVPLVIRELDRRGLHGGWSAHAVVIVAGALVVYGGATLLRE